MIDGRAVFMERARKQKEAREIAEREARKKAKAKEKSIRQHENNKKAQLVIPEGCMTLHEIAVTYNCGETAIFNAIKRGALPSLKMGRHRIIAIEDFLDYKSRMKENSKASREKFVKEYLEPKKANAKARREAGNVR